MARAPAARFEVSASSAGGRLPPYVGSILPPNGRVWIEEKDIFRPGALEASVARAVEAYVVLILDDLDPSMPLAHALDRPVATLIVDNHCIKQAAIVGIAQTGERGVDGVRRPVSYNDLSDSPHRILHRARQTALRLL